MNFPRPSLLQPWSHHHLARTYWDYRHLPNLLFVHYDDLKRDLLGEMRRIARFGRLHRRLRQPGDRPG